MEISLKFSVTENVNEYLRLSAADVISGISSTATSRHQAHNVKAAFEKRNQKSTEKIAQLQRKLETYSRRLHDIDQYGPIMVLAANKGANQRQARAMLKDVSQGLK